jgi:hypothetical protein
MSGYSCYKRFPFKLISELESQLEAWRTNLPPNLAFSENLDRFDAGEEPLRWYLRQKYLTCRALTLRPFAQYWLSTPESDLDEVSLSRMSEGFISCVRASTEHLVGLKGFSYTVMANAWIASLSYVYLLSIYFVYTVPWSLSFVLSSLLYFLSSFAELS